MAEAFYPFVENGESPDEAPGNDLMVRQSARIAVYDDAAAAPRVVTVNPTDVRSYLEEITATVTRLAQEQGGHIPFTVIREIVENLIHAYFIEPTISILDGGDTIRFSDQGPGIQDKDLALKYGTTSATTEMKRYIRGVGSGLPYAQQWLEDKGGSLSVEDNIHKGCVVTISLVQGSSQEPSLAGPSQEQAQEGSWQQGYQSQPYQQAYQQAYQQVNPWQQPQAQPMWGQPYQQQAYQQPYQQPYQAQPYQAQPYQQGWQQGAYPPPLQQGMTVWPGNQPPQGTPTGQAVAPQSLSDREQAALDYLRMHESVGPRDLNGIQPLSESTWSRVLSSLEGKGLISKQGGQKRHLTPLGRQLLGL